MRASGWPVLTCGSSDSGSEPLMYRSTWPAGGSALPKYSVFCALAAQADVSRSARTAHFFIPLLYQQHPDIPRA